jgi:DNA-directed RNA polymerase
MDILDKSWKLTEARFDQRNELNKSGRVFCETPHGRKVTADLFLAPLTEFLSGKYDEKPDPPPRWLSPLICDLAPEKLALMALAPLLDSIYRGWEGRDLDSAEMLLKLKIGAELRDRLALEKHLASDDKADRAAAKEALKTGEGVYKFLPSEWTNEDCVRAGHWLMQCALSLDYFTYEEDGFPGIAPAWQNEVDRIREDMLRRDPVLLPHISPPPDWTGPIAKYDARLEARFVRDWRPETQQALKEAFEDGSIAEHVRGVNALQRVPLRIDTRILTLVEKLGARVLNENQKDEKKARHNERIVRDAITTAKYFGDEALWLTYNCDKRGRVYAIPHLNYGREDHVRSLFKFYNGLSLGRDGLRWLEIHCATCGGFDGVDKLPFTARVGWALNNRALIRKIAADPEGTFHEWKDADKPFQFVAACIELASAWNNPSGFITHLPVAFDGTCSGIQHLSLLSLDRDAGAKVNLSDNEFGTLEDVYSDIIKRAQASMERDDNKWATWWLDKFRGLGENRTRKLLKTPAGTFAYAATNWGRHQQITKVYSDLFDGLEPKNAAGLYLAAKIQEAAEESLRGPARLMRYIQKLTEHCNDRDRFLTWTSPTGFPCCNRYNKPNVKTVNFVRGGVRIKRHDVAEGCLPEINKRKTLSAAAANFTHSMDAAHLM